MNKYFLYFTLSIGMGLLFGACQKEKLPEIPLSYFEIKIDSSQFRITDNHILYSIPILEDVNLGCYFDFMDTLVPALILLIFAQ